jgi:hypothetical protein
MGPPCTTGGSICFTSRRRPHCRWSAAALILGASLAGVRPARADGAFPDSDSIVVPDALPDEILLGTNFGLVLSVDDGVTWTWSCEQPGNAFGNHYQMGAPTMNRLYAQGRGSTTATLAYSDDAGCSWQVAGGGVAGAVVLDAFPDPTDAGRVLALVSRASDGGMSYEAWESGDGGATFATRRYATADDLTGVETARSDPATIYLTLVGASEGGPIPELARSTDGGATWTLHDLSAGLGTHIVNLRLIAVDPDDAGTVFLRVGVGGGEQVAVTRDGGATVAPVLTFGAGDVAAFARMPATGDLIVGGIAGVSSVAFRSTDGGSTFQPLPTPPHLRALAARGTRLYAVADNYTDGYAIGTSDDEGMTWQPLVSYGGDPNDSTVAVIGSVAACLAAACQSDCLTRAGMGQWAPDVCGVTSPIADGGAVRDATADAPALRTDAASRDAAGRDASVAGHATSGCSCDAGSSVVPGPSVFPLVGLFLAGPLAPRRRRAPVAPPA